MNLDCEYEFCHEIDKKLYVTHVLRMQGCSDCTPHGAVPYAKCRISLATTVL